ncbi:MAG: N-acetyltransferase [Bifidobacteriaceae bacterium]|jgi:predicted GNAT family acetyltransferase|nr:N-acetyltransferase [Bifidobacteriaceae bacterium]
MSTDTANPRETHMSQEAQLTVENNQSANRYELTLDGARLGVAQYESRPGALDFTHTVISSGVEGRGLGGVLIGGALDDARARGLAVFPYCTFVRHFIDQHPEYLDLIPAANRPAFGFPTELPQTQGRGGA